MTEVKERKDVLTIIIGIVTAIMILAGIAIVWYSSEINKNTNEKLTEYNSQIVDLEKQAKSLANTDTTTKEDVEVSLKSCSELGTKIAECQNFYNTSDADASSDESRQAIKENAAKMKALFDKCEDKANVWYTNYSSEWVFNSTYSFTDTTIPVLWTCLSKSDDETTDGSLLAYATGIYNNDTKMFSDIEVHVTRLGSSMQEHD